MIPLKIVAIIMLVSAVAKYGHPFRAAVVLAVIGAGLSLLNGADPTTAAVSTAVGLVVGIIVFWLIDRTKSFLLWILMTMVGVAALILYG